VIPVPFNEQFRLAVLQNFNVLDTHPEERFDRITRVASRCFDVPIAVISLVAAARQWFKSSVGLEESGTPREISFCGHAIMDSDVYVIPDATQDPRFADNPLVTGKPRIRFYAGAPLVTANGFRLGTLCLIDQKPREEFSEWDKSTLCDLAAMTVEELYRGIARSDDGAEAGQERAPGPSGRSVDLRTLERDEAHKAQLVFITSLSHELRTPLNAIIGFSEALSKEIFGPIDNDRYVEYAQHISASGTHLSRFVDSILDFAKGEKGEISLREDWVDVAATVRTCMTMVSEEMRKADLQFIWNPPDHLPLLRADPQLVMQMLVNLIGNSIKFTKPDGIIQVAACLGSDGGLTLSVADSGIGVGAEDLQKVLLPFGQVDNAMTRKHGGTGLGLSLTKQFAELHDAELTIESQCDAGTTVCLRFPPYRVA